MIRASGQGDAVLVPRRQHGLAFRRCKSPTWLAADPAAGSIFAWINRYNSRRRHSTLGYIAPITWEQQYSRHKANPAA
jgi:transposase InsO family protein